MITEFAADIKYKRVIENDMTVNEAAKACGVTGATISRMENSGIPNIITYSQICAWLGKDMEYYMHIPSKSKSKNTHNHGNKKRS